MSSRRNNPHRQSSQTPPPSYTSRPCGSPHQQNPHDFQYVPPMAQPMPYSHMSPIQPIVYPNSQMTPPHQPMMYQYPQQMPSYPGIVPASPVPQGLDYRGPPVPQHTSNRDRRPPPRQARKERDSSQSKDRRKIDSPPSYDQACALSTKLSKTKTKIQNQDLNFKEVLYQNSISVEEDGENSEVDRIVSSRSRRPRAEPERAGAAARGSSKGRGSRTARGGRGKLRGKFSMMSRRERRSRDDLDQRSEVTASSVGQEQDELSVEVQRQLINELEFAHTDEYKRGIIIEVKNGFSDYEPFALKNFLEYCTRRQSRVIRMVVASDKQSAIAIFDSEIDCDELEAFVAEQPNHFLDLELDFDFIDELSAAIIFSEESVDELIQSKIADVSHGFSKHIKDYKEADDVIVMSFKDINQDDLQEMLMTLRENGVAIYPLYPYPENKYMHVIKSSFIDFDLPSSMSHDPLDEPDGYKLLLSGVDDSVSDVELRKAVKVAPISGGDSSAKVLELDDYLPSEKVVSYSTAEVCVRVMGFMPIKMRSGNRVAGYPSLRVDVPTATSSDVSKHFLLLTGPGVKELSKDVIQYFFTNYARHPVQRIYYTKEEQRALVMFSSAMGSREPSFADLYEGLTAYRTEMKDVMAWRVAPVLQVKLPSLVSKEKVKAALDKWKETSDTDVKNISDDPKVLILEFTCERDAIKFLARDAKNISFGKMCSELPVVPALASTKLYSDKLSAILPASLLISDVVEELGYSEDHAKFIKFSKNKKLHKMYSTCMVFCHHALHEYRYDKSNIDSSLRDVAQQMRDWQRNLKDSLQRLLAELKVMEERTVRKSDWLRVVKQRPGNLYVIEEPEGSKNMRVRALGSAKDVEKLEELLTNQGPDKETSGDNVTFSLPAASFFRHHYLPMLKKDFPSSVLNLNTGSELATLTVKGSAEDVREIKILVEEHKAKLAQKSITINSDQWEFLSNRNSRAFAYVNREILEDVQYFCTTKGNHKLVTLTSTEKEKLGPAESAIRKGLITKHFCIEMGKKGISEALDEWQQFTKPMLEKQLARNNWPVLITEPSIGAGKVVIVTVSKAAEVLDGILRMAAGSEMLDAGDSKDAESKKPKPKVRSKAKKQPGADVPSTTRAVKNLKIVSESESDDEDDGCGLGARPKVSPRSQIQPLLGFDLPPFKKGSGIREMVRDPPPRAGPRRGSGKPAVEEVKLTKNCQYIDFQYVSNYYDDMADTDGCDIEIDERAKVVRIKAATSEDAKKVQKAILGSRKKLHKQTRRVHEGTSEMRFYEAAKDLKLRFLLNSSVEILDYDVQGVSVKACKPAIQCIQAQAVIIAVKNDLYMNQSNIGSLLAAADPEASRKLRQRHDSDSLDEPGSCQELSPQTDSVLWDYYLVVVVDPSDKDSLKEGFMNALERCQSLRISSVVTNLLGSDMSQFVSDRESAAAILSSLYEYTRNRHRRCLQTLYLCETNDYRIKTLTAEIKKYGRGVDFVDDKLPGVGCPMISVCSKNKRESEEFFRKCSQYLA